MRPDNKAFGHLEYHVLENINCFLHMNHERRAKSATSTAERSPFNCKELVTTSQGWRFFRPRRQGALSLPPGGAAQNCAPSNAGSAYRAF